MSLDLALRNVLLGSCLLGLVGGALGSFALLRRQSLLGDALAHAALPGVALAYLLTGGKGAPALFIGALIAGVLGSSLIMLITRLTRLKEDAAFGIVLSVFFGLGIVLLTVIQKQPGGNQSGLDRFLFGQAATLMARDLRLMAAVGAAVVLLLLLFFKELKLLAFDRDFGASLGLPMRALELLLAAMLVAVVVLGLQTVGVILMVATLIAPAAAARQWTDRLGLMVALAALLGAAAGIAGALASGAADRLPTGPAIVLAASGIVLVSLLAAPRRGILAAWFRRRRGDRRIAAEHLLKDLYKLGEERGDFGAVLPCAELMELRGQGRLAMDRGAASLRRRGLIERAGDGLRLSAAGHRAAAGIVRKHRLWELYLSRYLDLPGDHVHRDADEMEHALGDAEVERLAELLSHPETDPHGEPIPPRRGAP